MTLPLNASGVTYTPDIVPSSDWARDLNLIRETGLRVVRSGEFIWSWIEPEPGRFDLDPFNRYLDQLESAGLKLVLATPTATPPPWLDRVVPDARMQTVSGAPFLGFREFACRNHPEVLVYMERMIETLAAAVQDRPSLIGWQLDNEPHYGDGGSLRSIESLLDFHPHAWAAFVTWMQQTVERPEELDDRWVAGFWSQRLRNWADLQPALVVSNPHARLDWMRWRDQNLADHLRCQMGWIRRYSPDLPIGTNLPSCGLREQVLLGIDPVDQCRELDWVGGDVYGADGNRDLDLARVSALTDLQRSAAAGKPFLIAEAQASPHERVHFNFFAAQHFPPEDLEEVWTRAAQHGAQSLWWFQWRGPQGGIECGMNGMAGVEGHVTAYTDTAHDLTDRSMAGLRKTFEERPAVLLGIHRDSLRALAWSPELLDHAENAFLGWHRLLEEAGYRVEFCEACTWNQHPDLPLILYRTPLLSRNERQLLAERSGFLWCGPDTGFYDEQGRRRPDPACPLQARQAIQWGPWHDHPPPAPAQDWPALSAFRDLSPASGTETLLERADGTPSLCRHGDTVTAGFCFGEAYMNATEEQKRVLCEQVQSLLLNADSNLGPSPTCA